MMPYLIAFLTGSIIGSFLNVCIYRIPRNLSVVRPSSRCPSCNAAIRPYDNIPIVSFLILKGRCRHCRAPIPLRYPFVEALNAVLYVAVLWRYGFGWHAPVLFAFCSALIVITFIDLDHKIIPNAITLPGIAVGLAAGSFILPDPFAADSLLGPVESLIGAVSGGGLFYLVAVLGQLVLRQEALGAGDIKLMTMVGAFMGWKSVLLTTFAGSLLGSVIGISLMAFKGMKKRTQLPFGTFLSPSAILALLFGREILALYLR